MKTRIAMIWGGKSVEHEVSVISGIQAYMAMDQGKYDLVPVYMTKENEMYIGPEVGRIEAYRDIPALLKSSQRVVMVNDDGRFKLVPYPQKRWGGSRALEFDLAFPVVHGTNVEDGALQGYLKTVGVPFVGPDVTASAISMDKFITKAVLKEAGVPVLDAAVYTLADYRDLEGLMDDVERIFGYPVIVKPVNLGSSVGIGIAKDRNELSSAVDDAFVYATRVIVEHAISNLKEINCAVLGDENEAIASECEEPLGSGQILSYEDKYVNGGGGKGAKSGAKISKGAFDTEPQGMTGAENEGKKGSDGADDTAISNSASSGSKGSQGAGMANLSRRIPANISDDIRTEIRELAIKSFKALGCNGVSRIDFMIDMDTGELFFNEINPIPGSLSFYLWEPAGVPYPELLDRMVELALARARREESITYRFDTNILQTANLGGNKGSQKN